jgi:hypothetical protein
LSSRRRGLPVASSARRHRRRAGELLEASPSQALVAPEVADGISTVLLELSGIAIGLVRIEPYTLLVTHDGRPTRSRSDAVRIASVRFVVVE